MRAKEFIPASKPRNFVVKNQKTSGAGSHKDKKKAEKQGDVKHKGKQYDEGMTEGDKEISRTHKGGIVTKTAQGIKHTKTDYDDEGMGWRGKDKTDFDKSPYKKFPILDKDDDMDEGWKEKLAAAGLAGAMALGAGNAAARVSGDQDPNINRLTGKPIATQMAPSDSPKQDMTPLSSRYDSKYQGSPEAYTIKVDGKLYKFAGRTAEAPKTGEKIKVPAAAVGIRGLSPVTVELGNDGMYYPASAD